MYMTQGNGVNLYKFGGKDLNSQVTNVYRLDLSIIKLTNYK